MTHKLGLLTGYLGMLLLLSAGSAGDPKGTKKFAPVIPSDRAGFRIRSGHHGTDADKTMRFPGQGAGFNSYHAIAERNMFDLKPAPPPFVPPAPQPPPKEDLFLTGLMSGIDSGGTAFFMVTAPDQPPRYFTVMEGDQNDWLEVLSVDTENGTVKVRLKKPVIRIQNVGKDVLISFRAHGIKTP